MTSLGVVKDRKFNATSRSIPFFLIVVNFEICVEDLKIWPVLARCAGRSHGVRSTIAARAELHCVERGILGSVEVLDYI